MGNLLQKILGRKHMRDGQNEPAPTISVILPYYNDHDFLPECLTSIEAHLKTARYEIIIVDDGSPDTSFLHSLGDPHIKVLYLEGQNGPSKARNTAIHEATGDYLLFIDSDDTLTNDPAHLLAGYQGLAREDLPDMLVGQEDGTPLAKGISKKTPFVANLESEPKLARLHYFFAMLYRRQWILDKGILFREDLSSGGDLAFLGQALSHARSIYADTFSFYRYRRRPNSITHSPLKRRYAECRLKMIHHIFQHLSPFPEASTLHAFGTFKTNLSMTQRATEQLGRNVGLWFVDGLAKWARTYLSDDTMMTHVLQTHYVDWSDNEARLLAAARQDIATEELLDMVLETMKQ